MTLRPGNDRDRVHEQLDRLLRSDNCLIMFVDGSRTVSYARGFGLSPCQLELVIDQLERTLRSAVSSPSEHPQENQS